MMPAPAEQSLFGSKRVVRPDHRVDGTPGKDVMDLMSATGTGSHKHSLGIEIRKGLERLTGNLD